MNGAGPPHNRPDHRDNPREGPRPFRFRDEPPRPEAEQAHMNEMLRRVRRRVADTAAARRRGRMNPADIPLPDDD